MPVGKTLRLETLAPALVHWSNDDWQTTRDINTMDTGIGVHVADLPTGAMPEGTIILFTFYWMEQDRWEGVDLTVSIIRQA